MLEVGVMDSSMAKALSQLLMALFTKESGETGCLTVLGNANTPMAAGTKDSGEMASRTGLLA